MSYLDRLKEHLSENPPPDQPPKPLKPGFGGLGGDPGAGIFKNDALREWRRGVASLKIDNPLHGIEPRRWRTLWGDANWFVDQFGGSASRDGWRAFELFGIVPGRPRHGGLIDRLDGARSLVMGEYHASWRSIARAPLSFGRGCFGDVGQDGSLPACLVMLWGAGQ